MPRKRARLRYNVEPGTPSAPTPVPAPPAAGATFTQDDLTRIAAEQKARGEREAKAAADAALAEKLGGTTLDELLALKQAKVDAENAAKTEAERLLDEAKADRAAAAQERAAAATEKHATAVRAALIAAGVPEAGLDAVHLDVAQGADAATIKAAVDALKTKLPGLFATTVTPSADPGKPGTQRAAGTEFGADGASEFEKRYGKTT